MRHISVATVSQYFLQEADTRRALFINRRFTHFLLDVNLTRSFRFTDGTWRDYKKTNKQTNKGDINRNQELKSIEYDWLPMFGYLTISCNQYVGTQTRKTGSD